MDSFNLLSSLLFLALVEDSLPAVCYYQQLGPAGSVYCEYHCCGYYSETRCCRWYLGAEVTFGIILGSVSAFCIIISIIVCIICNCCMKNRGQTGTVIEPGQNVTVVSSTDNEEGRQYLACSQYQYPVPVTPADLRGHIQPTTSFF